MRPRRRPRPRRLLVLAFVAGLSSVSAWGFTTANTVAASRADDLSQVANVNEMKPAACNGITLTTLVVGTNGTNGSDLLLGSAVGETLTGNQGTDCVVGGGGNDTLWGNGGAGDVCIGGPGTDTFGFFGFLSGCETQIQ